MLMLTVCWQMERLSQKPQLNVDNKVAYANLTERYHDYLHQSSGLWFCKLCNHNIATETLLTKQWSLKG